MAKTIITPQEIEQLTFILSEISDSAESIRQLAIEQIGCEAPDMAAMMPVMIQKLAAQIGWASDLAGEKLGSHFVRHGTAEAWMMPPAYHSDAPESAAQSA